MVIILLIVMAVLMVRTYQRDSGRKTLARQNLFNDCLPLLENPQTSQDQGLLPVLKGQFEGYQIALSVVEDTLGWRKLPPLWLLVKVTANKPSRGTLDIIARPSNNEFYSPSWQWDGNLALPEGWPQHAIAKYQQRPADTGLLHRHVQAIFSNVKLKELLVTPAMVRLTYMAKQADRGEYLIMRNAVYDDTPFNKSEVATLLKQAVAIRRDIELAG